MSENKELFGCDDYEESCGCGCGCDDHGDDIITLTLEDGKEVDCAIIAIFPVEDKDYIALLPLDEQEEGEIYLYEFKEKDDSIELLSIESDEEYEAVTEAFDEILEEADFEELFEE
ncbi:MAG TPA: DUF1292 domain-containing protein [Tissierellia bacterium]|jgi:uncharacterized protein YrzB (UPF0473 family)|nr:DUF1292 domain-containing protein [Tissierellia bacterium]